MLQPEELRIGNWILEDSTIYTYGTSKTERTINLSDFQVRDKEWSDHWDMIKPIPLNEVWLLKFGFKRFPWGLAIDGILFKDNLSNPCEKLTLEVGNGFRTTVEYVHTLQNLFYALTGEELTLNNNHEKH